MAMQHKQTSHVLHLIMTFLTGGIWLLVWVWCATSNSRHNARLDQEHQRLQTEYMRKIAEGR